MFQTLILELEKLFNNFEETLNEFDNEHGFANSRARLRMATLYQVAAANSGIVVGTGFVISVDIKIRVTSLSLLTFSFLFFCEISLPYF